MIRSFETYSTLGKIIGKIGTAHHYTLALAQP